MERWKEKPADHEVDLFLPWHEIRRRIDQPDWVRTWSAEAGVPTLSRKDGKQVIGYDDPESAKLKGAWARARGLAGIFFWQIEQDFREGDHEIVRAGVEGLLRRR